MNSIRSLRSPASTRAWMHWSGIGSPGGNSLAVHLLMTVLFAAVVGLGFTVLGFLIGAHTVEQWLNARQWRVQLGANVEVSLVIAFIIQGLYALGRRLFGVARLQAFNGWQRTLYFAGIPMLGTALGWPLGVTLLFGDLHILERMTSGDVVSSVVLSAFVSTLFFVFFSLRIQGVRAEARANEAQLRLLQGQMEPHFLFNTLANVVSLVEADPPRARQMLEALTDYLRVSLGALRHDDSTLEKELELARRYLQLMQVRMGERLRFEIDVDAPLNRAALMPLVLQPLIENAVKHGLEPQVDGGTVRVKATRVAVDGQDCLRVCVEDDGAGQAAAAQRPRRRVAGGSDGNGIALANLRERLGNRFGTSASLVLEDLSDGADARGTRACIVIPWRAADAASA